MDRRLPHSPARRAKTADLAARGEPFVWLMGGALIVGILMIAGFLALVLWNGFAAFWPAPIELLTLADGARAAGEVRRAERFLPEGAPPGSAPRVRTLYRVGNYDLYGEDFRWIDDGEIASRERPGAFHLVERTEWGPFVGRIASLSTGGSHYPGEGLPEGLLERALDDAATRRERIRDLERDRIGEVNRLLDGERLALKKIALSAGEGSPALEAARAAAEPRVAALEARYAALLDEARALRGEDEGETLALSDAGEREKTIRLSEVVRLYAPNRLSLAGKLGVFLSRWREFILEEPREANTEGGVMPALFGTFAMTLLMALLVAPLGVVTALYLREYARQGKIVSLVRISVNNLAGVPSIVYGVFGLGFFAYALGGRIDALFYPERLPNPTFGTGGLLWASLTLALLTVPVVIVATEEALASVPASMREGSLACGASKWQTIRRVVLPKATPGIMTGLILAMARGAGEVAPLMLVGVVKLAPELPVDGVFPYVHLERSFMHLGFHIYDVGFQSRNAEAGKPMVFVTTLLLIAVVFALNFAAIVIRNRLKKRFAGGHF